MGPKLVKKILGDITGATAIEYALIAAMVFLAAAGAMTTMGISLNTMFDNTSTTIGSSLDAANN